MLTLNFHLSGFGGGRWRLKSRDDDFWVTFQRPTATIFGQVGTTHPSFAALTA
jgi:hypothetical protein